MSKNSETIGHLKKFFELKKGPDFAVLLSAPWGSGKTWMIKEIIKSYESESIKFLYISLNGVDSIDEIENEYFRLLNPVLGGEKFGIAGSLLESAVKAGTRFEIDKNLIKKFKDKFSNHDNYVLVFDDLERCGLTIKKILGYINDLVEHKQAKVVIIANEEGIEEKDYYSKVKEKLVGLTLRVEPDIKSAIDSFKDLPDLVDLFPRYDFSDLLVNIFNQSNYKNLRNIKQSLAGFSIFSKDFDDDIRLNEELCKQLLAIYLIFSSEIKSGSLDPEKIATMQHDASIYSVKMVTGSGQAKSEDKPLLYYLQSKYSYVNFQDRVFSDEIWSLIFGEGYVEGNRLIEAIKSSHYFSNVNTPAWQVLWYMDDLSDTDFNTALANVLNELNENRINDLFVLLHVAGMLLRLSDNKIFSQHKSYIKNKICSQIDRLFSEGLLPKKNNSYTYIYHDSSHMGLSYQAAETSEFKEIREYADKRMEEHYIDGLSGAYDNLIKEMVESPWVFYEKININGGKQGEFSEVPIFAKRDCKEFAKLMLDNPKSTRVIGLAFKERYITEYSAKKVLDEMEWVESLIDALEEQKLIAGRSISKVRINSVIEYSLRPALESLKKIKSDNFPLT